LEIYGNSDSEEQQARTNFVDSEYFSLLHIPLASGRFWIHDEIMRGAPMALVNQTLAHRYWPDGNALGQRIRIPELKSEPPNQLTAPGSAGWLQIVGVVSDVRDDGLRNPVKPAVYLPYSTLLSMWTQILVRTQGEPLAMLRAVREKVREVDPDQQILGQTRNLEQWIAYQPEIAGNRLTVILLAAFSIFALALSAFGLYSVVSHSVAQRTNEFGIRIALGAQSGDVNFLVLSSTAISVGGGLAIGVILSLAMSRVFATWTQHTSGDFWIVIAVMLVLVGVAILACLVPARRAASIDPISALRFE